MRSITVRHRTIYRYATAVALLPHRVLLHPRESGSLRVTKMDLLVTPDAEVEWTQDVTGNLVATLAFHSMTSSLTIETRAELQSWASPWPVFDIAMSAIRYPFRYDLDEVIDLGALTAQQYEDQAGQVQNWAKGFVCSPTTDTLSLLKDLNAGISAAISYQSRDEEGTQSPSQTLDRGWGSCRDFAVLLVEAARSLGFGARIVSGYCCNPADRSAEFISPGTTHAWAEIYLPGAGWIAFDPTNRTVGGHDLIPVAVGRDIRQVTPVAGSFIGLSDAFLGMSVEVFVSS